MQQEKNSGEVERWANEVVIVVGRNLNAVKDQQLVGVIQCLATLHNRLCPL